jgi:two-component system CheB/CheR fusion protein
VLSGTGSDGTLGIRDIKGEGGMVMVQSPASTEYDGMPRSAIDTGLVDYEIPPAEMFAYLQAYTAHAFGKASKAAAASSLNAENMLRKIFILLRAQTGHDFSQYKPSTIHRRIERRMAIHQIETMDGYVKVLQQTPIEVEALFRDLLIGVTSFFRDSEAFEALEEQVIPKLFANKPAGTVIRVWVPGCSTGEEAYSIAILLQEHLEVLKQNLKVQVFATDIDNRSIAAARMGLYPASIAEDISPSRLARFFTSQPDGASFRIHKNIRDLLVFSEQDVIKDPPFSKLDLISCRNLLIYMGSALQKKLILLFHYALNEDGFLFLGTSETVGDLGEQFSLLNRKAKIYQHKVDLHSVHRTALSRSLASMATMETMTPPLRITENRALPVKVPLRELTEQALLQQVAPAAALINRLGDILYLHGRTGMFLEPTPGEAGINNILKMAREGLRRDLTMALHKAAREKKAVRRSGVQVKTNGDFTAINLTVSPVTINPIESTTAEVFFLVIMEEAPPSDLELAQSAVQTAAPGDGPHAEADVRIEALKQELQAKEEYLQATTEELETSNEELKSSNEEMQSVNEELQSTNEELETSKEELQSINEELATVNAELQTKVMDLSRANNDMNNLLAGTGIGTVFVDHGLRILRFTPAATRIINLIATDIGRPVGHLASNLVDYDSLQADTQEVLNTLVPHNIEVRTIDGKWYTMRIRPYRTLDNVIEGAVITFEDTTELKEAQTALSRLAVVVQDAHDAVTVQDLEGRILAWNPAATRMYGWSEAEALTMNIRELIPEELQESALTQAQKLSRAEVLKPYRAQRIAKNGTIVEVRITATALVNNAGQTYAIATTERTAG